MNGISYAVNRDSGNAGERASGGTCALETETCSGIQETVSGIGAWEMESDSGDVVGANEEVVASDDSDVLEEGFARNDDDDDEAEETEKDNTCGPVLDSVVADDVVDGTSRPLPPQIAAQVTSCWDSAI